MGRRTDTLRLGASRIGQMSIGFAGSLSAIHRGVRVMAEQLLELGVLIALALACGGIGLLGARYLTEKSTCCTDGGGHAHAPPPDPPGGEERSRPVVLARVHVPVTEMGHPGRQQQGVNISNRAR